MSSPCFGIQPHGLPVTANLRAIYDRSLSLSIQITSSSSSLLQRDLSGNKESHTHLLKNIAEEIGDSTRRVRTRSNGIIAASLSNGLDCCERPKELCIPHTRLGEGASSYLPGTAVLSLSPACFARPLWFPVRHTPPAEAFTYTRPGPSTRPSPLLPQ